MKTLYAALLIVIGITFSTTALADCYSCSSQQTTYNSCSTCTAAPQGDCAYNNKCICSEPSCGRNPCLSKRDCCEAFGNVGAYTHH